jgi:hypothetical protein
MIPAAIGLRTHSGWAALVAVAESPTLAAGPGGVSGPQVIGRQRISLTETGTPAQPYHAAQALALGNSSVAVTSGDRGARQRAVREAEQSLDLTAAEALLRRCAEAAEALAHRELWAVVEQLRQQGYEPRACGILAGSGRAAATLRQTLASHAALHTAEGELYRNALAEAAAPLGLQLSRVRERDIWHKASATLGIVPDRLQRLVAESRKSIGPPWRQDEKLACLAGWLALATLHNH